MFSLFKIFILLVACFAVACVAKKKNKVNQEERKFILIVNGLNNLKTVIRMYNIHITHKKSFALCGNNYFF